MNSYWVILLAVQVTIWLYATCFGIRNFIDRDEGFGFIFFAISLFIAAFIGLSVTKVAG